MDTQGHTQSMREIRDMYNKSKRDCDRAQAQIQLALAILEEPQPFEKITGENLGDAMLCVSNNLERVQSVLRGEKLPLPMVAEHHSPVFSSVQLVMRQANCRLTFFNLMRNATEIMVKSVWEKLREWFTKSGNDTDAIFVRVTMRSENVERRCDDHGKN